MRFRWGRGFSRGCCVRGGPSERTGPVHPLVPSPIASSYSMHSQAVQLRNRPAPHPRGARPAAQHHHPQVRPPQRECCFELASSMPEDSWGSSPRHRGAVCASTGPQSGGTMSCTACTSKLTLLLLHCPASSRPSSQFSTESLVDVEGRLSDLGIDFVKQTIDEGGVRVTQVSAVLLMGSCQGFGTKARSQGDAMQRYGAQAQSRGLA